MATRSYKDPTPTSSSNGTPAPNNVPLSSSWSIPRPSAVSSAMSGLLRRFSAEPSQLSHVPAQPKSQAGHFDGVYTPPYRNASPFQPPPLYPISLTGHKSSTPTTARLLNRALAEEIRLLVPPRLQLCEEWKLVYSLEEHGVSLGTLYKKCEDLRGVRNGFVLVVRDGEGALFGAYLTEAPHPSAHYYGTGECFLWRASILSISSIPSLANLPPPPSADTTNMTRSTTIASPTSSSFQNANKDNTLSPPSHAQTATGASTPERIRFKAFPYSGVNDYMIYCDHSFLSVGGGDGHYGLWLDDNFERGISSACLTFGNEPLSEEGEKFGILGVEVWTLGS